MTYAAMKIIPPTHSAILGYDDDDDEEDEE
jgi:hypothetical protein